MLQRPPVPASLLPRVQPPSTDARWTDSWPCTSSTCCCGGLAVFRFPTEVFWTPPGLRRIISRIFSQKNQKIRVLTSTEVNG